jgi:PAS domain S-box-containing protein
MSTVDGKRISRWISIPFSLFVLAVCVFYTYAAIYLAPYPGFEWGSGDKVSSVDPCRGRQAWCETNQGALQVSDVILAVNGVDFGEISKNLQETPFGEYNSGDLVSITVLRNGREQTVDWLIVGPSAAGRAHRLFILLLFFVPFWLNGTLVLFVLGPRGQSRLTCLLLASFNYATAIWLTAGSYSSTHVMYSALVEHALSWLLVPVYFHFHLIAPTPLIRRWRRYVLGSLYAIAAVLVLLELFQVLPVTAFGLAIVLGFLSSLGMLIFRLVFNPHSEDRQAVILMLVGITISFGPAILVGIIPMLLGVSVSMDLAFVVSWLAVPLLPFFYVYAIFKRYLGSFESRLRRGLGLYSFLLLYVAAIATVFYLGSYLLGPTGDWDTFIVAMWTLFGVAAVPLYNLFQKSFGRLAYGVTYDMSDMLRAFSTQVQAIVGSEEWMRVLADELDSRLLIHQSALCLFIDGETELVYARSVDSGDVLDACQNAQRLLADAGRYRSVADGSEDELGWIRLAIPLQIRGKTVGVWLFGQRDPDSYYSQDDITLLTTLASQATVVVENDRLYDKALQEIAERAQMEEALRESEEKLQAVLNATTESVILMDVQGTILALNQTAARRLGTEIGAVVGRRGADLVAQGTLSIKVLGSRMAAIGEVFRLGEPVQFEDERDGVIYDSSVYPIFDADGQVRRVAIFASDVTARKQAERQAVQVERLAAMEQIAGVLAHEINNPLQAVRSNLEMLVDFDLGLDTSRERLGIALEEIQYLGRVTHGVLEFTKLGKEDFRRVSAAELLQQALALADERLRLAQVQVVTTLPDQPIFIFAVPNQIVQALFSLIANAAEAMPSGAHLDIAIWVDGEMANLSLTGSGISLVPDQIEHLFDPFFADEVGNAGLGLWISRGIIERHSGIVSVQNSGDQGVVFEVALPLYSPWIG